MSITSMIRRRAFPRPRRRERKRDTNRFGTGSLHLELRAVRLSGRVRRLGGFWVTPSTGR